MRLLLIEDDPTLGEGLRDYLRADGHRVDWCVRLSDTDALRGEPYDAWLVDWQLPDGSGLDCAGAGAAAARATFGEVEVDLGARAAYAEGQRADLTAREWAVLEALVLRAGRIVTKGELEKIVLGFDSELASNALEVHVSALRRKLGRALIQTVRGLGYRIGGGA
jgi:two-component system OmpR family response regulator